MEGRRLPSAFLRRMWAQVLWLCACALVTTSIQAWSFVSPNLKHFRPDFLRLSSFLARATLHAGGPDFSAGAWTLSSKRSTHSSYKNGTEAENNTMWFSDLRLFEKEFLRAAINVQRSPTTFVQRLFSRLPNPVLWGIAALAAGEVVRRELSTQIDTLPPTLQPVARELFNQTNLNFESKMQNLSDLHGWEVTSFLESEARMLRTLPASSVDIWLKDLDKRLSTEYRSSAAPSILKKKSPDSALVLAIYSIIQGARGVLSLRELLELAAIRSDSPVSYARKVTLAVQEYIEQATAALDVSLRVYESPTKSKPAASKSQTSANLLGLRSLLNPIMYKPTHSINDTLTIPWMLILNETVYPWLADVGFNVSSLKPLRSSETLARP